MKRPDICKTCTLLLCPGLFKLEFCMVPLGINNDAMKHNIKFSVCKYLDYRKPDVIAEVNAALVNIAKGILVDSEEHRKQREEEKKQAEVVHHDMESATDSDAGGENA